MLPDGFDFESMALHYIWERKQFSRNLNGGRVRVPSRKNSTTTKWSTTRMMNPKSRRAKGAVRVIRDIRMKAVAKRRRGLLLKSTLLTTPFATCSSGSEGALR
jgi:hypothetical protein